MGGQQRTKEERRARRHEDCSQNPNPKAVLHSFWHPEHPQGDMRHGLLKGIHNSVILLMSLAAASNDAKSVRSDGP